MRPAPQNPTPCISCGYDLSGIDPAGQCPECAAPVEQTTRFSLASQPLPVLNRLRSGPIWLFSGLGAQVIVGGAGGMLGPLCIALYEESALGAVALALVGAAMVVGAQAVSFVGYWRLTTPLEGGAPAGWRFGGFRRTIRVASVIMLSLGFLNSPLPMLLIAQGGMTTTVVNPASPPPMNAKVIAGIALTMGAGLVLGLTELVRYLGTAAYASALAARIPDLRLAKLAARVYRLTAWLIIGFVALIGVFIVSTVYSGAFGSTMGVGMILSGVGLLGLGLGAFALWIAWIVVVAMLLAGLSKVRRRAMEAAAREAAA